MIWPWYLAIGLTILLIVGVFSAAAYSADAAFGVSLLVGVPWLVVLILTTVLSVSRHYDRISCHAFSEQTNRQTKFVIYTTFSWDCLTPDGKGRWIPTANLREFGSAP